MSGKARSGRRVSVTCILLASESGCPCFCPYQGRPISTWQGRPVRGILVQYCPSHYKLQPSARPHVLGRKQVRPITREQVRALTSESQVHGVRVRRDVDNPTGTVAPPSEAGDSASHQSSATGQNLLGPYSYSMFSGQCYLCPPGVAGPRGPPGPAGLAGRDGRDGRDAQLDVSQASGDIDTTGEGSNEEQDNGGQSGDSNRRFNSTVGGVVYTRWGRSECPDGSDLIYKGVSAGSHFSHTGGASNYLCMPLEPVYDEYSTASSENRGLLYSAEYETNTAIDRLKPLHNHSPVCAVCRAPPGRTTKLMVPARNDCPSEEWRLEYGGYLMSAHYGHAKSTEFVCVDRDMEAEQGTHGDQNGALFYMVEAVCVAGAGLPCDPYKSGRELTCAVCTI